MPRKVPGWDWACPVRITGIDWHTNKPRPILGIDALQTLELAMQYARATLMAVRERTKHSRLRQSQPTRGGDRHARRRSPTTRGCST